ncbi:yth1p, partial [Moniliophthora roreri]
SWLSLWEEGPLHCPLSHILHSEFTASGTATGPFPRERIFTDRLETLAIRELTIEASVNSVRSASFSEFHAETDGYLRPHLEWWHTSCTRVVSTRLTQHALETHTEPKTKLLKHKRKPLPRPQTMS